MSKIGNSLLALTVTAAGAIAQNRFVGFDNAQATVQAQKVKGVADYAAAVGKTLTVTAKGTAYVEAGGAFNAGDPIISDNQGRGVVGASLAIAAGATAVTSSAANGQILTGGSTPDYVVGHALEASAGAGSIVEIMLK